MTTMFDVGDYVFVKMRVQRIAIDDDSVSYFISPVDSDSNVGNAWADEHTLYVLNADGQLCAD